MNIAQQIAQAEQRIADLSKAGTPEAQAEIVEQERELLKLYRAGGADKNADTDNADDAEAVDVEKQRSLLLKAAVRIGADVGAVLSFFSPRGAADLIHNKNGSWKWHDGQSILAGLRAELPAELHGLVPHEGDNSPIGKLRQRLADAKRDYENAKSRANRNGFENAQLVAVQRQLQAVRQLESELAALQRPDAPPRREPSQSEILRLRSLEAAARKARAIAEKDRSDRSVLEFDRANREYKAFKAELGV